MGAADVAGVGLGQNPWTPLLTRSLNAWPLNMTAFDLDPIAGQGEPSWWTAVALFGVVWAVFLTFVILPVFTLFFGKFYCSHICSCGALAETVGSSFRHRGPKGDTARWVERFGYVVIPLAVLVTVLHLMGIDTPFGYYNSLVGTFFCWGVGDRRVSLFGAAYLVSVLVPVGILDEFLGALVAIQNFG